MQIFSRLFNCAIGLKSHWRLFLPSKDKKIHSHGQVDVVTVTSSGAPMVKWVLSCVA